MFMKSHLHNTHHYCSIYSRISVRNTLRNKVEQ